MDGPKVMNSMQQQQQDVIKESWAYRGRKNRNGGVNIAKVHVANYTETKKIVIE